MRILIVGASRGVGLETVRRALAEGHHVRALARGAERIAIVHPRFEPCAADATDSGAVGAALEDADAVILTLGVSGGLRPRLAKVSLFSEATRTLVGEMHRAIDRVKDRAGEGAGPRRLVAVTGFGAGDSRSRLSLAERIPHRLLLGPPYDDKDRQEVIIRGSGLDWLIVRPTLLTRGARTGRYRVLVEPRSWRNGLISRADVADFLVREATRPTLSRATPVLAY